MPQGRLPGAGDPDGTRDRDRRTSRTPSSACRRGWRSTPPPRPACRPARRPRSASAGQPNAARLPGGLAGRHGGSAARRCSTTPLPGTVYLARPGRQPLRLAARHLHRRRRPRLRASSSSSPARSTPTRPPASCARPCARTRSCPSKTSADPLQSAARGPPSPRPPTCGTYTTNTELVPWTSPEGPTRHPLRLLRGHLRRRRRRLRFLRSRAAQQPQLRSGHRDAAGRRILAAASSRSAARTARSSFAALNADLPPGPTGKLAGPPDCPDAQLAQAAARTTPGQGAARGRRPSCPAASQFGTATVGAGSGSPLYVTGNAYLAGPYKGAPVSLAIVTPAIAGPFDLGTVVVRARRSSSTRRRPRSRSAATRSRPSCTASRSTCARIADRRQPPRLHPQPDRLRPDVDRRPGDLDRSAAPRASPTASRSAAARGSTTSRSSSCASTAPPTAAPTRSCAPS